MYRIIRRLNDLGDMPFRVQKKCWFFWKTMKRRGLEPYRFDSLEAAELFIPYIERMRDKKRGYEVIKVIS